MATLTLTLSAGDIKKAVKSDTYISGQIDKAADSVKNAALAYNESAGDDAYHEVKLYRTMKGAVSKFEANMIDYVDPSSGSNVANTLTTNTGDNTFTITIPVGSRFYAAFANTLSALAQEYIINIMLYTWWQSIKPALAKDYYQFAQESISMVVKTLSKTPPAASLETYTDVTGDIIPVNGIPEYNQQEDGYFYLKGSIAVGDSVIKNPIVELNEVGAHDDNFPTVLVVDGEDSASGIWRWDEINGKSVCKPPVTAAALAAVGNAAVRAFEKYGKTVLYVSGETSSSETLGAPNGMLLL